MVHVIEEKLFDAKNGSGRKTDADYNAAHGAAINAESAVMGGTRRTLSGSTTPQCLEKAEQELVFGQLIQLIIWELALVLGINVEV